MKKFYNMVCRVVCVCMCFALCHVDKAWAQQLGNMYSSHGTTNTVVINDQYKFVSVSGDNITGQNVNILQDGLQDKSLSLGKGTSILVFDLGQIRKINRIDFIINLKERNGNPNGKISVEYGKEQTSLDKINKTVGFNKQKTTQKLTFETVEGRYFSITFDGSDNKVSDVFLYEVNFQFNDSYTETNESPLTIRHKKPKWYFLREGGNNIDTFEDAVPMFPWDNRLGYPDPTGGTGIQASHVYIDTIYMHRGSKITLDLPARNGNMGATTSYQRWYNFRTDGLFRTKNKGTGEVWDLLTPAAGGGKGMRIENGYVGQPLTDTYLYKMDFYCPKEDEYEAWFGETTGDDWFVVACDVSDYNDFTETYNSVQSPLSRFDNGTAYAWEPTLMQRVLFFIQPVDNHPSTDVWKYGYGRLEQEEYQGGGLDGKYLVDMSISYPSLRMTNKTNEFVALNKDPQGYSIPGADIGVDAQTPLEVKLVNNTSGIKLVNTSLTGTERCIFFTYPTNIPAYGIQEVPDGSKATILVTKTVGGTIYNLARFDLTFKKETVPLTQSMLENLSDNGFVWGNELWKGLEFRTEDYLSSHYKLLTFLDFDYDPLFGESYGRSAYYPYPLSWGYCSYGFFDGAPDKELGTARDTPVWGTYALMKDMFGYGSGTARPLPGSTFHLYVDASDRPGSLVQIPFRENLCIGTELVCTAWVKNAGLADRALSSSDEDAGLMFSIYGVDEKGKKTVLARHISGQLRHTSTLNANMPGCGKGKDDWFQCCFKFMNKSAVEYEHYEFCVDNYCSSTAGGDYYLDDIRVYIGKVSADLVQLETTCVNERTRMNMDMDWERLLSRTGKKEVTGEALGEWDAMDFCFVDTVAYYRYKTAHPQADIPEIIQNSLVGISDQAEGDISFFGTLFYNLNFGKNIGYDTVETGSAVAGNNIQNVDGTDRRCFYSKWDKGQRSLSVDFYSMLSPNKPYLMLVRIHDGMEPTADLFTDYFLGNECVISTLFFVTSENMLKMNGEIVDPSVDYCAGQIFDFTASLRIPIGNGEFEWVDEGVYFDWFFGLEYDFTTPDPQYGNVSLYEALKVFRSLYPDALEVDAVETPVVVGKVGVDGMQYDFTQQQFDILYYYSHEKSRENHMVLTLHRDKLDIQLMEKSLDLVICPIQTLKSPDPSVGDDQWKLVCWGYTPLTLRVTGGSPVLHTGYNSIQYPVDGFNPNLRVGLAQLRGIDQDRPLSVKLRGADFVNDDNGVMQKVTSTQGLDKVFLVGTDDPEMKDYLDVAGFTGRSYPVGWLDYLYATQYVSGKDFNDEMLLHFDFDGVLAREVDSGTTFKFVPREGFYYTLVVYFEERVGEGGITNACYGQFPLTLKVVPEYLVWNGGEEGNWNNDGNWLRVNNKERLQKPATDTYPDGNETESAFVPMVFSKVIVPAGKEVELYMGGFLNFSSWKEDKPEHIGLPTENIQYDLMAYTHPANSSAPEGSVTAERFRVNMAGQIHFEPGARMLHPEYLVYDRAWVDYELSKGVWHTLSSPLEGVVAGDFYTHRNTGREEGEFFKDITYSAQENNRFSPSVYQRGWKPSDATLVYLNGNAQDKHDTAVKGNWTGLFNDVAEPYGVGQGFSLKVQDLAGADGTALFRLPKADTRYDYYKKGSEKPQAGVAPTGISDALRENAGRLKADMLYVRNKDYGQIAEGEPIRVTLSPASDGRFYLVGNPFMAHLDVVKFFEENRNVLQPKYWTVEQAGQAVAVGDGNGNWTAAGEGVANIAPLHSFFVEKTEGATSNEVVFTADMQTLSVNVEAAQAVALKLRAFTPDGRTSRATVAFGGDGGAENETAQGAELFLDSNIGDVPVVYTVGRNRAWSVQAVPADANRIPLGVYGMSDETVTLAFEGVAECGVVELYDAHTRKRTLLHDGFEMEMSANDDGRYYLLHGDDGEGGLQDDAEEGISVYSVRKGEIMVASPKGGLRSVQVYAADGRTVARETLDSDEATVCRLNVPESGICVVSVKDVAGRVHTVKLQVR